MNSLYWTTALAFVLLLSGNVSSQEVSTSRSSIGSAERSQVRDERPDPARGWVVVAKATYWPLCYDALERLDQVQSLAATEDTQSLAETLEKCSAWLNLAASAAMVNEDAKIHFVADQMDDVAATLFAGKQGPSQREIVVLAANGKLAIARSHLIRCLQEHGYANAMRDKPAKKDESALVKEASAEIRKARIERDRDQYRYDTGQSYRHLTVAMTYLNDVVKNEGLDLGELADTKIEPLRGDESSGELTDRDSEIRLFALQVKAFIEKQQTVYVDLFKWEPPAAG